MARAFRGPLNESAEDELEIVGFDPNPDITHVIYFPYERLEESDFLTQENVVEMALTILSVNEANNYIEIHPLNTLEGTDSYLKPKYSNVKTIRLEGFGYQKPKDIQEVLRIFEQLPSGFVKSYEFGLGFQRDYRYIVNVVEEMESIDTIVIRNDAKVKAHTRGGNYILSFNDFEVLRRGIDKISNENRRKSRMEKDVFAFNGLLHRINPEKYPEKRKKYTTDVVYKFLDSTSFSHTRLSSRDTRSIINFFSSKKKEVYETNREKIIELQNDLEIINLEWLIDQTSKLLSRSSSESEWQMFFTENPFVLFLAFGYPVISIQSQAFVGGIKLNGSGEKITDFLIKNNLTNNSAIVEIKKPSTNLIATTAYRGNVFAPSKELSGSISQLLDQKHKLQKNIASIKDNSEVYDLETYAVDCVLIIGTLPDDKNQKRSFEMFRYNSKDVRVYTFDELFQKLNDMYSILKTGRTVSVASDQH